MSNSLSDDSLWWYDYVPDDLITQFNKLNCNDLTHNNDNNNLFDNWKFHYVLAWFYNVCDSYYSKTILQLDKIFYSNIEFDEFLLFIDNNKNSSSSLINDLKLKLIQQLYYKNSIQLSDCDNLIDDYFNLTETTPYNKNFTNLSIIEKFNIFYNIIKIIQSKNLSFKNYITNNNDYFDLFFNFPYIILENDDNTFLTQLFFLPSLGTILRKDIIKLSDKNENITLDIPIKLKNCTINKKIENETNLIHLDYSTQIDNYINNFNINYKILSNDLTSYLNLIENSKDNIPLFEFLTSNLQYVIEHSIYSKKLLINIEKKNLLNSLIINRKRSSRLIEQNNKKNFKIFENFWFDKINLKNSFIKKRNRFLNKNIKFLKNFILFDILFKNFNKDLIIKDNNNNNLTTNFITDNELSIINSGINFLRPLIENLPIKENTNDIDYDIDELPTDFFLSNDQIDKAIKYEIINENLKDDYINEQNSFNWKFNCHCDINNSFLFNCKKTNIIDLPNTIKDNFIICCDLCHNWQHWNCQNQDIFNYISKIYDQSLIINNQKDFATIKLSNYIVKSINDNNNNTDNNNDLIEVVPHSLGKRRSTRRNYSEQELFNLKNNNNKEEQNQEQDDELEDEDISIKNDNEIQFLLKNRPTDKRTPYDETHLFICGYCINNIQNDLRLNSFKNELKLIKENNYKKFLKIEKRKKLQQEKKLKKQLEKKILLEKNYPENIIVQNPIQNNINNNIPLITHIIQNNNTPSNSNIPQIAYSNNNNNVNPPLLNENIIPISNESSSSSNSNFHNSTFETIKKASPEVNIIPQPKNTTNDFIGKFQFDNKTANDVQNITNPSNVVQNIANYSNQTQNMIINNQQENNSENNQLGQIGNGNNTNLPHQP